MPITTGQARTDLYGKGKGEAQTFERQQADFMHREDRAAKQVASKAAAKQKAKQKRQDDLTGIASKVGTQKVMPGEEAQFVADTDAIYQMAMDMTAEGGDVSPQDKMKLMASVNQLNRKADISQDSRKYYEGLVGTYDENKHWEADLDASMDFFKTSQGDHTTRMTLPEKMDMSDVVNDLRTDAAHELTRKKQKGVAELTKDEAKGFVANRLSDPKVMHNVKRQMEEDGLGVYEEITDEMALDNFATDELLTMMAGRTTPVPPSDFTAGTGRSTKLHDFTFNPATGFGTITPPAEKRDQVHEEIVKGRPVSFKNPKPHFNKEGKLDGGTYIQLPTGEKSDKNKAYLTTVKTERTAELKEAREEGATDQEIRNITERYQKKMAKLPYPGKTVILTGKNAIDNLLKTAYNMDVEDVLAKKGGAANYIEVQTDVWQDKDYVYEDIEEYYETNKLRGVGKGQLKREWEKGMIRDGSKINKKATSKWDDTKWNSLKPGESMIGPDGKTYIKK